MTNPVTSPLPETPRELPKCPFCGAAPRTHTYKCESLHSHETVDWLSIGCADCDYAINGEDHDELRAQWNRRSPISPAPAAERVGVELARLTLLSRIAAAALRYTDIESGGVEGDDMEAYAELRALVLRYKHGVKPPSSCEHKFAPDYDSQYRYCLRCGIAEDALRGKV